MFNLDALRQEVTDALRTHGREARQYCERIIAAIESVREAVLADAFEERRIAVQLNLTADTEQDVETVPGGADWMIESISSLDALALTINADGRFIVAKQFNSADTSTLNIPLPRGANLTAIASGNAAPVRVNVWLRIRRPVNQRRGQGGFPNAPTPDGTTPRLADPHRHAA